MRKILFLIYFYAHKIYKQKVTGVINFMENLVVLNTKKYLGRKQIVLDCKFQIESGKEVQKVLAVCGKPVLTETTVTNGNVNFVGKVNVKLVYLTESNERECLNCLVDFNEYYDNSLIEIGDFADIELKVVDVTTPSIKANEVKVACILDAVISLSKNKTCEQASENDDIFYKKSLCEISKQVANFKDSFDVSEEFRIEGDLKCVLSVDVDMAIKECYCGNGFAVVGGDAYVNIIYEDESDEIKMYKTNFAVKQEVQIDNVNKDCIAVGQIVPLDFLSKCTVAQGENCNIVRWEAPVNVSGVIYENFLIDKIDDAYACKNNVELNVSTQETIKNLVQTTIEDTVKGEVPLKDEINATLLGYMFSGVEVSSSFVQNDKLTIEGVVSTTILYKDENQENQNNNVQSVIAEFPFSVEHSKAEFDGVTNNQVTPNITDLDVGIKNNKIELVTKLQFNVFCFEDEKIDFVDAVSITSPRKPADCAMEIIIVQKEQTLWELGKSLGVSVEQILEQNPNIVEPLNQNDKIVIYHNYKG